MSFSLLDSTVEQCIWPCFTAAARLSLSLNTWQKAHRSKPVSQTPKQLKSVPFAYNLYSNWKYVLLFRNIRQPASWPSKPALSIAASHPLFWPFSFVWLSAAKSRSCLKAWSPRCYDMLCVMWHSRYAVCIVHVVSQTMRNRPAINLGK